MSSCDRACTGQGSFATPSQVINTAGLCNDYIFRSGNQAKEIWLGSPDLFLVRGVAWARDYLLPLLLVSVGLPLLYVTQIPGINCKFHKPQSTVKPNSLYLADRAYEIEGGSHWFLSSLSQQSPVTKRFTNDLRFLANNCCCYDHYACINISGQTTTPEHEGRQTFMYLQLCWLAHLWWLP